MNLRHLRVFVSAARLGSLNAASDSLRLSQSAASYAISSLEALLGRTLLLRGPTGCSTTRSGELALKAAGEAFALLDTAVVEVVTDNVSQTAQMLSLGHIRAATTVAQFSQPELCAQLVGTTVPALLRKIREIEQIFGRSLFSRNSGSYVTYDDARDLLRSLTQAREIFEALQSGLDESIYAPGTVVNLACVGLAQLELVPAIAARFAASFPNVTLRLSNDSFAVSYRRLLSGEVDVVLATERPGLDLDLIEQSRLYPNRYALVCQQSHPLATKKSLTIADIANYHMIMPKPGNLVRRSLEALAAEQGLKLRIALEAPFMTSSWALTQLGDRIMLASVDSTRALGNKDLCPLPYDLSDLGGHAISLTRRRAKRSPVQRALIELIASASSEIRQQRSIGS